MSIGLLVDMAFWTFKTIISFFFFLCVALQYGKKVLGGGMPSFHSVLTFRVQSTYLLFRGSKNPVLFIFKIDFFAL